MWDAAHWRYPAKAAERSRSVFELGRNVRIGAET